MTVTTSETVSPPQEAAASRHRPSAYRHAPSIPDAHGALHIDQAWHPGPPHRLEPDEIHVWWISLRCSQRRVTEAARLLEAGERQRAGRFRFPKDQDRFVLARAFLRRVLAEYEQRPPVRLEFATTQRGKPNLAGPAQHHLGFNLSHTAGLAVCAVSRGRPLGIDVERLRPEIDTELVGEVALTQSERQRLRVLPRAQRKSAFFRLWVRKEALVKAIGLGLSIPPASLEVANAGEQPGVAAPSRTVRVPQWGDWRLTDIAPPGALLSQRSCCAPRYVAALATWDPDTRLTHGIVEARALAAT